MAVKIPLVIGPTGWPEQLQPGDTLSTQSGGATFQVVADAALLAGQAVYMSGAAHVNKARANASGTVPCVGLVTQAISSSATGPLQVNGIVTLTTAQWDAICGTSGGLAYDTIYYLDPANAGKLTGLLPTTPGLYVQVVGTGLDSTDLILTPDMEPILL